MNKKLVDKLAHLRSIKDQVFFRWRCCSKHVAAMHYSVLSLVRLESLSCRDGRITLSLAAAYISDAKRGSVASIIFRDNNIIRAKDAHGGYNMPLEWRRSDTDFELVPSCESYDVTEHSNSWVASRVLALSTSPYFDVNGIVQPYWYRRTKTPKESLQIAANKHAFKCLGWKPGDTVEAVQQRFTDNLDLYGQFTDDGYVVPFDLISRGGMVCCAANEILTSKYVYCISGNLFRAEAKKLRWDLKTGKGAEDGIQDLGGLAGGLAV